MNYELFDHWEKKIYLINMLKEDHQIFSELFEKGVKNYLQTGKKIWILINKKWHTWGTICKTCGHIPQCDRCSVAIHYYLLPNWEKSECATSVKNNTNFQNPVNNAIAQKSRNTVWELKNLLSSSKKLFELKVLSLNQNPFAHQKKLKNFLLNFKNIKILKRNQLLSEPHFELPQ